MPAATRRSPPSTTGHRRARRCCGRSPVARKAGATTAGAFPARGGRSGWLRGSDPPSASSTTLAGSDPEVRKSACSPRWCKASPILTWSKGWASCGSSLRFLSRFPAKSVDFTRFSNWSPRFASNWTHQACRTRATAQSPCRFCPKRFLPVYLLSNRGKRAPIAKPADGAIAFLTGGSRCRRSLHASVEPLTSLAGASQRCSRPSNHEENL